MLDFEMDLSLEGYGETLINSVWHSINKYILRLPANYYMPENVEIYLGHDEYQAIAVWAQNEWRTKGTCPVEFRETPCCGGGLKSIFGRRVYRLARRNAFRIKDTTNDCYINTVEV